MDCLWGLLLEGLGMPQQDRGRGRNGVVVARGPVVVGLLSCLLDGMEMEMMVEWVVYWLV